MELTDPNVQEFIQGTKDKSPGVRALETAAITFEITAAQYPDPIDPFEVAMIIRSMAEVLKKYENGERFND